MTRRKKILDDASMDDLTKRTLSFQYQSGKVRECPQCHLLIGVKNYETHICPVTVIRPVGSTPNSDKYNRYKNRVFGIRV
jgi:hypothetical protein